MIAQDPHFIERCIDLREGESASSFYCNVHRYEEHNEQRRGPVWYVFWNDPQPGNLGRAVFDEKQLRGLLEGGEDFGITIAK